MIRLATPADERAIWAIYEPIVAARTTYALSSEEGQDAAMAAWMHTPAACYVAEDEQGIHGTYYIKANAAGPGSHVCNAGFMTAPRAQGRGLGRLMGSHALSAAAGLGFRAMQFNMVVASNAHAVRLWRSLGFVIIGTVPHAFDHAELGTVDAFIMYRAL